jgi:hypothetical protein
LSVLERRARDAKSRALVRSWEYRQRNLARGIWFELRRILADTERAFVLSDDVAAEVLHSGAKLEAAGARLEPKKRIMFVTADELSGYTDIREIPVNLGVDFVAARNIALLPFPSCARRRVVR